MFILLLFWLIVGITKASQCGPTSLRAEVVCHWNGDLDPGQIDPCKCTLLVVTKVKVGNDLRITSDSDFEKLNQLRQKNHHLRILISIGDNSDHVLLARVTSSVQGLSNFTMGVMEMVQKNDLDGVELKWNGAVGTIDGPKNEDDLTSLMKVLRLSLDQKLHGLSKRDTQQRTSTRLRKYRRRSPYTKKNGARVSRRRGNVNSTTNVTHKARGSVKFKDYFDPSVVEPTSQDLEALQAARPDDISVDSWNTKDLPSHRLTRPLQKRVGSGKILMLRLPVQPEFLVKGYDLKNLTRIVDLFAVPTHNLTASTETDKPFTYHHSRLMGVSDIENADSLLDLVISMGVPAERLVMGVPALAGHFTLVNPSHNTPRSPATEIPTWIPYWKVCSMLDKGNWTIERDGDRTVPYAFNKNQWISFDDSISIRIKSKYALLRGLAGMALHSLEGDDDANKCGLGSQPLLTTIVDTFRQLSRRPRRAILRSLVKDLEGSAQTPQRFITTSANIKSSPYRIVRVVDKTGAIRAIRSNSEIRRECSRQGYYRDPDDCSQFYRCVKFDQYVDDYTVFEYACPVGLVFDDRWEVCVWPSTSIPCDGSSEIFPIPRNKNSCNREGFFVDPENCRWFYACKDYYGNGDFTVYEFRCPFGLAYDETNRICNWPWLVSSCAGQQGAVAPVDNRGKAIGKEKPFQQGVVEKSYMKDCVECDDAEITIGGKGIYHEGKGIILSPKYFEDKNRLANNLSEKSHSPKPINEGDAYNGREQENKFNPISRKEFEFSEAGYKSQDETSNTRHDIDDQDYKKRYNEQFKTDIKLPDISHETRIELQQNPSYDSRQHNIVRNDPNVFGNANTRPSSLHENSLTKQEQGSLNEYHTRNQNNELPSTRTFSSPSRGESISLGNSQRNRNKVFKSRRRQRIPSGNARRQGISSNQHHRNSSGNTSQQRQSPGTSLLGSYGQRINPKSGKSNTNFANKRRNRVNAHTRPTENNSYETKTSLVNEGSGVNKSYRKEYGSDIERIQPESKDNKFGTHHRNQQASQIKTDRHIGGDISANHFEPFVSKTDPPKFTATTQDAPISSNFSPIESYPEVNSHSFVPRGHRDGAFNFQKVTTENSDFRAFTKNQQFPTVARKDSSQFDISKKRTGTYGKNSQTSPSYQENRESIQFPDSTGKHDDTGEYSTTSRLRQTDDISTSARAPKHLPPVEIDKDELFLRSHRYEYGNQRQTSSYRNFDHKSSNDFDGVQNLPVFGVAGDEPAGGHLDFPKTSRDTVLEVQSAPSHFTIQGGSHHTLTPISDSGISTGSSFGSSLDRQKTGSAQSHFGTHTENFEHADRNSESGIFRPKSYNSYGDTNIQAKLNTGDKSSGLGHRTSNFDGSANKGVQREQKTVSEHSDFFKNSPTDAAVDSSKSPRYKLSKQEPTGLDDLKLSFERDHKRSEEVNNHSNSKDFELKSSKNQENSQIPPEYVSDTRRHQNEKSHLSSTGTHGHSNYHTSGAGQSHFGGSPLNTNFKGSSQFGISSFDSTESRKNKFNTGIGKTTFNSDLSGSKISKAPEISLSQSHIQSGFDSIKQNFNQKSYPKGNTASNHYGTIRLDNSKLDASLELSEYVSNPSREVGSTQSFHNHAKSSSGSPTFEPHKSYGSSDDILHHGSKISESSGHKSIASRHFGNSQGVHRKIESNLGSFTHSPHNSYGRGDGMSHFSSTNTNFNPGSVESGIFTSNQVTSQKIRSNVETNHFVIPAAKTSSSTLSNHRNDISVSRSSNNDRERENSNYALSTTAQSNFNNHGPESDQDFKSHHPQPRGPLQKLKSPTVTSQLQNFKYEANIKKTDAIPSADKFSTAQGSVSSLSHFGISSQGSGTPIEGSAFMKSNEGSSKFLGKLSHNSYAENDRNSQDTLSTRNRKLYDNKQDDYTDTTYVPTHFGGKDQGNPHSDLPIQEYSRKAGDSPDPKPLTKTYSDNSNYRQTVSRNENTNSHSGISNIKISNDERETQGQLHGSSIANFGKSGIFSQSIHFRNQQNGNPKTSSEVSSGGISLGQSHFKTLQNDKGTYSSHSFSRPPSSHDTRKQKHFGPKSIDHNNSNMDSDNFAGTARATLSQRKNYNTNDPISSVNKFDDKIDGSHNIGSDLISQHQLAKSHFGSGGVTLGKLGSISEKNSLPSNSRERSTPFDSINSAKYNTKSDVMDTFSKTGVEFGTNAEENRALGSKRPSLNANYGNNQQLSSEFKKANDRISKPTQVGIIGNTHFESSGTDPVKHANGFSDPTSLNVNSRFSSSGSYSLDSQTQHRSSKSLSGSSANSQSTGDANSISQSSITNGKGGFRHSTSRNPSILSKFGSNFIYHRFGADGFRELEEELGPEVCERAGLFRHPKSCEKFYECYWDRWLGRFTLHVFDCPVTIIYDSGITGCNWPFAGPPCHDENHP